MDTKTRNQSVDMLKGLAMLLVVLGHTIILALILGRVLHQNRVLKFILFGKQP